MVIGAHIWGEDIEQSLLFIALKKAAALPPENKIILFTNSSLTNLPQNCLQVTINAKPKNKLLLLYWYNYKLPKLLLQYNINAFISNAGILASSNSVKQFLFIEHTDFLEERNLFFKKKVNEAVSVAQTFFVTDEVLVDNIKNRFPSHSNKIQKIYFKLKENCIEFSLNEIETIKEKYTGGLDYYLFSVDDTSKGHIITVLKSFSQLKKWQKTSLKMILLFKNEIDEKILPDFKNYKYKNEIVLVKETQENSLLLKAAAFSYIFFGDYNRRGNVYNALHFNIPIIAADTVTNNLLFKSAVSYAAATVNGLAIQLQLIYKDEMYKKQLQQKASNYLEYFDNNTASQKFLEIVSN